MWLRLYGFFLLTFVLFAAIKAQNITHPSEDPTNIRSFQIDYIGNQFLMDGASFRYVSGSFHYFRALPTRWRPILRTMRAGGLNAVDM